jgi:RNA polymerase sigma-70 factor, ECF subfamily
VRSDAELIRLSVEEPRLFEAIFDRYYDQILRFARQRAGHDVGEDIAARAFELAFELRQRFDPAYGSARPWLFGIATNLIRHHWRDERTHLLALQRLPIDPDAAAADDPDRAYAAMVAPHVLRAIEGLGKDDRATFLLAALTDQSYAEIAAALDIPVGTVRSRINRARRQLRERLDDVAAISIEMQEPPGRG